MRTRSEREGDREKRERNSQRKIYKTRESERERDREKEA